MKKRLISLPLTLLLLLSGCVSSLPQGTDAPALSADDVAQAVLAVCGPEAAGAQRYDSQLDSAGLAAYLSGFYRLPEGSWDDCAIYRPAASAGAFEIAVIRLPGTVDASAVLDGLQEYLLDRQGTFTGYFPEQAAMVENSRAVLSNGSGYAALLICSDPDAAQAAFFAALGQTAPSPLPSASPTASPSASPAVTSAEYPGRVTFTPPNIDDMTIYDTSAILAAWERGDPSALSGYDRTIYDKAAQVLAEVLTDGMSDYQKEHNIYRWIVSHVLYDPDHYDNTAVLSPDSSTPYNPLVNGKGICLGFSVTFQLLMDMAGVECITVVGAAFNSREDHAWNMVRLNGQWYCVDSTWDTGLPSDWWSYFNVTSDYMADTDHQWDYNNVPEATADDGGLGG